MLIKGNSVYNNFEGDFCVIKNFEQEGMPKQAFLAKRCYENFIEDIQKEFQENEKKERGSILIQKFIHIISLNKN